MIQATVDLFVAPKAPDAAKPVPVLGDAPKDFAKILEAMAGVLPIEEEVQTVFDLIGIPSEDEEEPEEIPEEIFASGIEMQAIPFAMVALIDILPQREIAAPALLEESAEMPTIPNMIQKDIPIEDDVEENPQQLDEPEQAEMVEMAALASEPLPNVKQPKSVQKNDSNKPRAAAQKIENEMLTETKEPDAKAPAETAEKSVAAPTNEPKILEISKEPEKLEKPEQFEQAEKSEKPDKLDKPEKSDSQPRRAAFSEFLTEISEQKTARNEPTATAPTQRPAPQFNLMNTGRAAFTEGLESVVRFARSEGVEKATLIVDPPALGRVSIEILSTANGIETSLRVSNEQVRALVQDQIVQLKHALQQMGVQVAEFSVDIGQQENPREQFSQKKQKNHPQIADKEGESEEEIFRVDLRKGLLHWIA